MPCSEPDPPDPDTPEGDGDGDGDGDPDDPPDSDTPEGDFEGEVCPPEMCKSKCVSELIDVDGDGRCWNRINLPFPCTMGICCIEEETICDEIEPRDTCTDYVFNSSWGSPGSAEAQFNSPWGIAVSPSNEVYVLDKGNDRIQKFTREGVFIGEVTVEDLTSPYGISFRSDGSYIISGYMEVAGHTRATLMEFDAGDNLQGVIADLANPFDIPIDLAYTENKVYVADAGSNQVYYFSESDGTWSFNNRWGITIAGDTHTAAPRGIAVDSKGGVYVVDSGNHKIKKFNRAGSYLNSWGMEGTGEEEFFNPWDIFIDQFDYVYVVDSENHRIQKFDSKGTFITTFGSYGSGDSQFTSPMYAFEDGYGNAYITDTGNNRVQLWTCRHSLCSAYNTILDVANDSNPPWEWETYGINDTRERVWSEPTEVTDKINTLLREGCLSGHCRDCIINSDSCLIPFSFKTKELTTPYLIKLGGNLTVKDINLSYWIINTIASVPYAERIRFSEGGNWTVRYNSSPFSVENSTFLIPVDADCKDLCFDILYVENNPPTGLDAYDAIDDAMYRLLDGKLDVNPKDGVIEMLDANHDTVPDTYFNADSMWFEATDELGIQTLWGPETAKLIVWE